MAHTWFNMKPRQTEIEFIADPVEIAAPKSYKGLYAFHKYWGKKPAEPFNFTFE